MLLVAFVAFFLLVLAWLIAPTGEIEDAPVPAVSGLPMREPLTA